MKRRELLKHLHLHGCKLLREGGNHLQTGDGSLYHSFLCHDTENRPLFVNCIKSKLPIQYNYQYVFLKKIKKWRDIL